MEGRWKCLLPVWVAAAVACGAVTTAGCGDATSDVVAEAVRTPDPETAFAPLVQFSPQERWRPMSAVWFVNRSVLRFAEDQGCPDRKIAVGGTLGAQRTEQYNWIGLEGLGAAASYFRSTFDADCEMELDTRFYADQHTRPYDADDRPRGLALREGFYIDLVDAQRHGPKLGGGGATAYVARSKADIDGTDGLRLTYWTLYGMNDSDRRTTHEGDWERVDVLLREGDEKGSYIPDSVRVHLADGARTVPWRAVERAQGTHPILTSRRGDHAMSPSAPCASCVPWRTWKNLENVEDQDWYDFGGGWGEPGSTDGTSGPLGPNDGRWLTTEEKSRERMRAFRQGTEL